MLGEMTEPEQGGRERTAAPGTTGGADARSRNRRERFAHEVDRLMDRLYGTAMRLTADPDDAEDVVAEAVARALERLDQLECESQLEGWLFRILNRTFISLWRRRRSRQDREVPLAPDGDERAALEEAALFPRLHQPFLLWWSSPEEQVLGQLLREDLQRAIDGLPDEFRIVVVLVELQGCSYAEVARLMETPLGTVRSRLHRARAMLQRALWAQARDAGLPVVGDDGGGQR